MLPAVIAILGWVVMVPAFVLLLKMDQNGSVATRTTRMDSSFGKSPFRQESQAASSAGWRIYGLKGFIM